MAEITKSRMVVTVEKPFNFEKKNTKKAKSEVCRFI